MAEIRIPTDQLPLGVWRLLQDISNKVTSQGNNAASLSASSSTPSSPSVSVASGSSLTFPQEIITETSSASTHPFTITQSCSSNTRNLERSRVNCDSKMRMRMQRSRQSHYDQEDDVRDDDRDLDEVDGGDVDSSIVHVVDNVTLLHQKSSHALAMEVMDESDIVRIFPDAGTSKSQNDLKSNQRSRVSNDSGIVRIFTNNNDNNNDDDDDDDEVDNDVVDHISKTPYNNFEETKSTRKSAFRVSPRVYPNYVQETESNSNSGNIPIPYNSLPGDNDVYEGQNLGHFDPRIIHYRKLLPGKSVKNDIYTTTTFPQQYKPSQISSNDNTLLVDCQMTQQGNNFQKNNVSNLPPSTPSKYANTIETTPTKGRPSKFGKIRRSPVLLPTPPQTPEDADGDDDDEVFSYDVISRSCTNIDNAANDLSLLRRNSDSRTTDSDNRSVRKLSTRSSPFPFSPMHKMARMKVGDRQHTRKRLSFEEVDPTSAVFMNDVESQEPHCWNGSSIIQSNIALQPEINPYISNSSSIHKMNNPPRGKSISPFNSPPRTLHQHNPASKSKSPTPFSLCDASFDIDRQLVRPHTTAPVCCSGSICSQSSPRQSHHKTAPPTNCHSSINMTYSDQSYRFINTSYNNVTQDEKDVLEFHHSRHSPSQQLPYRVERKARMRMHSEGFSEDNVEHLSEVARTTNTNDDSFFQPHPRVQTISSLGKRRRLQCDEDEDESELLLLNKSHKEATQTTPQKTSPTVSSFTSPTGKSTISTFTTTPNTRDFCSTTPQSPSTASHMGSHSSTAASKNNCSCATFMRSVFNMASGAFKNLKASPDDFAKLREDMTNINDIIRDSLSTMYKLNTICEHHKENPSPESSEEGSASMRAMPEAMPHTFSDMSPSNNLHPPQPRQDQHPPHN